MTNDRHSAPHDTICPNHPERPAIATCPRCGKHACFACWHPTVGLCHVCLMHDPAAAAPPIPWEDRSRGFFSRYFATIGSAFRPLKTAPAFASHEIRPAVHFALLSAILPALLHGIIPFTKTLEFGNLFGIKLLGRPTASDIAIDVARAAGISFASSLMMLLGLTAALASLASAYGERYARDAAIRMMLYRAFLVPLTIKGLFLWLFVWGLPSNSSETFLYLIQLLDWIPLILLIAAMRATVRVAGGVGPFRSYLVVVLALTVGIVMKEVTVAILTRFVS